MQVFTVYTKNGGQRSWQTLKMVPNLSQSLKRAIKIYIRCAVNYVKLGTFLKTVNRHSSIYNLHVN